MQAREAVTVTRPSARMPLPGRRRRRRPGRGPAGSSRAFYLVLLAPAAVWFTPDGSLDAVEAPILLRTGEHDEDAPAFHGDIVRRGVRGRIDSAVVPDAGHFSFQSPFPPELARPNFPPARDPEGFDREAYQPILHGEVVAFLRATL